MPPKAEWQQWSPAAAHGGHRVCLPPWTLSFPRLQGCQQMWGIAREGWGPAARGGRPRRAEIALRTFEGCGKQGRARQKPGALSVDVQLLFPTSALGRRLRLSGCCATLLSTACKNAPSSGCLFFLSPFDNCLFSFAYSRAAGGSGRAFLANWVVHVERPVEACTPGCRTPQTSFIQKPVDYCKPHCIGGLTCPLLVGAL